MYEYFDKDGDNSLTYNELKFGIYRLDLNVDSYVIDYFVKQLDSDGDLRISQEEFTKGLARMNAKYNIDVQSDYYTVFIFRL